MLFGAYFAQILAYGLPSQSSAQRERARVAELVGFVRALEAEHDNADKQEPLTNAAAAARDNKVAAAKV